jgi:hypothetical protein
MSWLSILLYVASNIPTLINIAQEVISLIHNIPPAQQVQAKDEIAKAISLHQSSGDTEPLKATLSVWKNSSLPGPETLK